MSIREVRQGWNDSSLSHVRAALIYARRAKAEAAAPEIDTEDSFDVEKWIAQRMREGDTRKAAIDALCDVAQRRRDAAIVALQRYQEVVKAYALLQLPPRERPGLTAE